MGGFISLVNTPEAGDRPKGRHQNLYNFQFQKNLQNFIRSAPIGTTVCYKTIHRYKFQNFLQ